MKKISLVLVAVLIMLSVLSGCSKGTDSPGAKKDKDTLVIGLPEEIVNLDPNDVNIQTSHAVKVQIYETLVKKDADGKLVPCLAESWEYEDGSTLIFHIRKGVKFHDGTELKASDVLFTLNRIKDMAVPSLAVAHVDFDKTAVVDDYTIKVVTKGVFAPQIHYLEWPLTAIVCEKTVTENGDAAFDENTNGTGPYKLVDYFKGDRIVLEAHKDYWEKGKPIIKNVLFRVITEPATRAMELETGGIDVSYDITPTDLENFKDHKDIDIMSVTSFKTDYFMMHCTTPPLDDVRVRRAIAYAIDVDTIAGVAYKGVGTAANGMFANTVEDFTIEIDLPKYDVEKAKQLLAEAGYPDGFTMKLYYCASPKERADAGEMIQNQLAKVGIKCEAEIMEGGKFVDSYMVGELDSMLNALTATTGEASRALGWFTQDNSMHNAYDWKTEGSDRYTSLVQKAASTVDQAERTKSYQEAQKILAEELPVIPLSFKEIVYAKGKYVKGFEMNATFESPLLKNVYFESN